MVGVFVETCTIMGMESCIYVLVSNFSSVQACIERKADLSITIRESVLESLIIMGLQ